MLIDIESIKEDIKTELIPYIEELFPEGKIPLYLSPLSTDDKNYISWSAYSSVGPNSTFSDNYCRADETGELFYPTETDDLQSCEKYFTDEIKELLDLNQLVYNNINSSTIDNNIETELGSDNVKTELEEHINEYTELKKEILQNEKTFNNLINISKIINELSTQLNNDELKTENKININNDTIEQEKYRYAPTNYYIYAIAVLVVIIFIIHFTVLYY
jgi:hypothetical protein